VKWVHTEILSADPNPDLYNAVHYTSPYLAYRKGVNLVLPEELQREIGLLDWLVALDFDRRVVIPVVLRVHVVVRAVPDRPEVVEPLAAGAGRCESVAGKAVEMPLAHVARPVAGVAERLRDGRRVSRQREIVGDHAVGEGILSRQETRAAGRTYRHIRVRVLEQGAPGRQSIQIRRLDIPIARTPQIHPPVLIAEYEQEVRPAGRGHSTTVEEGAVKG
jgi:hypothetical protein